MENSEKPNISKKSPGAEQKAVFPTAIVTGASAGIGREFALALARKQSHNLVITARRKERLDELKQQIERIWQHSQSAEEKKRVFVIVCDLTSRKERQAFLRRVDHEKLDIDLLVNNAGFGSLGKFEESDLEWEQNMIAVNCESSLHFCRHFLPLMSKRYRETSKSSAIINVSSVASFQGMPYMATYAATKAFLTSLSLALHSEVEKQGVTVLALCPGPTQSEFHQVVGLESKIDIIPGMSAARVVSEALLAVEKRRALHINGISNFLLAQLNRLLPRITAARIVRKMLKGQLSTKK
jgi:short-subunit dehydrogenase